MTLDQEMGTLLLLLDLSAAFDTMNHTILRTEQPGGTIGCAGRFTRMVQALNDRTQVVEVGGGRSQEFPLTTSVPRGSVLGPYCFCDTCSRCQWSLHAISRHGYADDIQLLQYNHFKMKDNGSLWEAI